MCVINHIISEQEPHRINHFLNILIITMKTEKLTFYCMKFYNFLSYVIFRFDDKQIHKNTFVQLLNSKFRILIKAV